MPKVGNKMFSYTKAGKKKAKEYAKKTGQSISSYGYGGKASRRKYMNGGYTGTLKQFRHGGMCKRGM